MVTPVNSPAACDSAQSFTGHVAVVTGGARGIGLATARHLASNESTVVLYDTDEAASDEADKLRAEGFAVTARMGSITDAEAVSDLFRWADDELGGADLLVNNAGVVGRAKLTEFDDDEWHHTLDVNLTGSYLCTKHFAASLLRRQASGAIVNVASMSYRGMTQQIAYASSKGGVVSLTRATALDLARHGIRANAVAPGMTETAMTTVEEGTGSALRDAMLAQIPMRRYAQPAEVAAVIGFLLSDDASYMTGEVLHVAGGARL